MPETKPYMAMASLSAALVTFAFGISVLAGY